MAQKYYAVRIGRVPGIYRNWDECKAQVHGYKQAVYKSFSVLEDAEKFLASDSFQIPSGKKTKDEEGIEPPDQGTLYAYVDGSYIESQPDRFSYGIVYITAAGTEEVSGCIEDANLAVMRNVAGEISGALQAMKTALQKGFQHLTIFHDYEGIAKWCLGEWRTNREGTKAYRAYYDSIKDQLDIKFVKVTGHTGVRYNEMADQLAKQALGIK